ncbi:MAG: rhomboid family intramembrane serine protease [Candidatus Eisenbacteria bacterium]
MIPLTFVLIGINVVVSLYVFTQPDLMSTLGHSPWQVRKQKRWYQLLTSGFVHADIGHLLMNMMTLYFFGPFAESTLGSVGFLIVYFGSLLGGSLLTQALHHADPRYHGVGASGAVSGVLFSFILFRPRAGISFFFLPFAIPAFLFAALYLAASLYGLRTRWGNLGHEAHLGGALLGVLLTLALRPDALAIFLSSFR